MYSAKTSSHRWSEWIWHDEYQRCYRHRLNSRGEHEYEWEKGQTSSGSGSGGAGTTSNAPTRNVAAASAATSSKHHDQIPRDSYTESYNESLNEVTEGIANLSPGSYGEQEAEYEVSGRSKDKTRKPIKTYKSSGKGKHRDRDHPDDYEYREHEREREPHKSSGKGKQREYPGNYGYDVRDRNPAVANDPRSSATDANYEGADLVYNRTTRQYEPQEAPAVTRSETVISRSAPTHTGTATGTSHITSPTGSYNTASSYATAPTGGYSTGHAGYTAASANSYDTTPAGGYSTGATAGYSTSSNYTYDESLGPETDATRGRTQQYSYAPSSHLGGPSAAVAASGDTYSRIDDAYEEFDDEGPQTPTNRYAVMDEEPNPEILDPRYRVEPSHRFQPGEIFKIYWSEPQGSGGPSSNTVSGRQEVEDRFGTKFFTGFRRYIVVGNDQGHCTCVPILTYGGKGCKKSGVKPAKHGIICQVNHKARLLDREPKLGFAPVRVEMTVEGEKLSKESRVNYSKLVTVEHNFSVFFIGTVVPADWDIVSDAVNYCWDAKVRHKRKFK